jgi:hypothetical protein
MDRGWEITLLKPVNDMSYISLFRCTAIPLLPRYHTSRDSTRHIGTVFVI